MLFNQKIKALILMDTREKLLLIEAYTYLAWARILKLMPFSKISLLLGVEKDETPLIPNVSNYKTLKNISNAVHIMSKYTFWESKCLVKAIAAMKMLERRKVESTLYLGTARDESGKMIAHAWLRSGSYYITGKEGMERFTIVGKFAKKFSDL